MLVAISSVSASAATLIYEGFGQTAGSLDGKAGGTGLSGNWTEESGGAQDLTVGATGLTYGTLPTTGGSVSPSGAVAYSIGIGSTLSDAGLMDDGVELWFSYVFETIGSGNTIIGIGNSWHSFTNALDDDSNSDSIGMRVQNSDDFAGTTIDNGTFVKTGNTNLALNETHLLVGRIVWGDGVDDTLTTYLPNSTLVLGSAVNSVSANLNQASFDTLSIYSNNSNHTVDEIRFGASYNDVITTTPTTTAIPEPSTMALLGLGVLALTVRRRC
ncbi:MAG: PEP-CTERM sorting domain-containing protein [Akkermansiaceae bacterium]